ncbi:glycosyl hydrolases family 28-domain-containing protein [Aspergillus parasiticus]|uniref:endo-polygalacturonase n=1 Tax=Aspergillus parasiticus TaxID=5067 RepID=A0A5N6DU44_ASPPA|nr:glycosyl hydrolases family 28-domain-containing protein [Aspergillus parasiticus]
MASWVCFLPLNDRSPMILSSTAGHTNLGNMQAKSHTTGDILHRCHGEISGLNISQLSELLSSPGDIYSSLSGHDLVEAKVKELVIMGGAYPCGYEYNFYGSNVSATAHVVNTWPGPMTFSGAELGATVYSGARLTVEGPVGDPVKAAYRWYTGYNTSRSSWDPLTVLYAINGISNMFVYANKPGHNYVYPDGRNEWLPDNSLYPPDNLYPQKYLKLQMSEQSAGESIAKVQLGSDIKSKHQRKGSGKAVPFHTRITVSIAVFSTFRNVESCMFHPHLCQFPYPFFRKMQLLQSSVIAATVGAALVAAAPVELEARDSCTFTSAADAKSGKTSCSTITLSNIEVPAGETLDLTGLNDGTTVIFTGETTFGYKEWEGPLISVSGTNIKVQQASGAKIDGDGSRWWDGEGGNGGKTKPKFFYAHKLDSSSITGLQIYNTPVQGFSIQSDNLNITDVTIDNSAGTAEGHNTDAFDIGSSTYINIDGATVYNQDDCLAINSGSHITFTNGYCDGGHGLSIGSVGGRSDNTVEDVTISNSKVVNSQNGVRIKTVYDATGTVSNVKFEDITLSGITKYGLVVEQDYENGSPTGTPTNGITVSGITFEKVTGTVESDATDIYILCGSGSCTDWTWSGVSITGGKTSSKCENVPNLKPDNIMVKIEDQSILEESAKDEYEDPLPQKICPDGRTIYLSRNNYGPTLKTTGIIAITYFNLSVPGDRPNSGCIQAEIYRAPELWDLLEGKKLSRMSILSVTKNTMSRTTLHISLHC